MRSIEHTISINIPDVADVATSAPQYARFAQEEGRFIFEAVMNPEAFLRARAVTLALNLPAVAGIASMYEQAFRGGRELDSDKHSRHAVGSFVRIMMEANGFRKTGRKRAVPHPAFSKAEVYEFGADA